MAESHLGGDTGLHLGFAGMATAGDGLLDFRCGVFLDGKAASSTAQQNDASGMSHQNRGSGSVNMGEDLFDDHLIRIEFLDDRIQIVLKGGQPAGQRVLAIESKDTAFNQGWFVHARQPFDAAIAGEVETGIDA